MQEGIRLPRAKMEVTTFHSPPGKACSSTQECLVAGVGAGWDHRPPEGSPAGWPPAWCLGPRVLCFSSPDVWASLPTWRPEGERGLPLLETTCGRTVSRRRWVVRAGFRVGEASHSP